MKKFFFTSIILVGAVVCQAQQPAGHGKSNNLFYFSTIIVIIVLVLIGISTKGRKNGESEISDTQHSESDIAKKKIIFWGYIKSFFNNYVNFKGTATRKEFWITTLITNGICPLLAFGLGALMGLFTGEKDNITVIGIGAIYIYIYTIIIPMVSLSVRRAKDFGAKVLMGLLPFIFPFAGIIIAVTMNPFTANVFPIALPNIFNVLGLIIFFIIGFQPSKPLKQKKVSDIIETNSNAFDDLMKLKDLLDNGILTQEEFDEQKKKILNKQATE